MQSWLLWNGYFYISFPPTTYAFSTSLYSAIDSRNRNITFGSSFSTHIHITHLRVPPYKTPQATPTLAVIPTGTGLHPPLIMSSLHYCSSFLSALTSIANTEFQTSSVMFFSKYKSNQASHLCKNLNHPGVIELFKLLSMAPKTPYSLVLVLVFVVIFSSILWGFKNYFLEIYCEYIYIYISLHSLQLHFSTLSFTPFNINSALQWHTKDWTLVFRQASLLWIMSFLQPGILFSFFLQQPEFSLTLEGS